MTDHQIVPPGIWLRVARQPLPAPAPALFLDRDGVIVEDPGFLNDPADVRLVDGIASLIAAANAADVPVAVVTNQSGIARGLLDWEDFAAVHAEIDRRLSDSGARVDAIAACPFHPDFTADYGPEHDSFRKPGPGMLELIGRRLNIGLRGSWLVGDRERDIEAARAAGLAGGIWLGSQAGSSPEAGDPDFRRVICMDLSQAEIVLRAELMDRG